MTDPAALERLREAFRRFAEEEAPAQGSPIYERLSRAVVEDDDLLAVAAERQPGQPAPNLLFGAVQAVLWRHPDHELGDFYPSVRAARPTDDGVEAGFRDFVQRHRGEVTELVRTRLVQTNEVRRCTALLPAFATVSADAGGAPLALIEVGPSAGLNLLVDRYAYDYAGTLAGDARSPLTLTTEVRGGMPPVGSTPTIASRLGIDLNALDVRSDADTAWLRALVWPEHAERRRVLSAAIEIARGDPPPVVSGDVFRDLPAAIAEAPADAAVVVFATFVFNQFTREMRDRFRAMILDQARTRPIRLVVIGYSEWFRSRPLPDGATEIWLGLADGGDPVARRLGLCNPHGWWIDWSPGAPQPW